MARLLAARLQPRWRGPASGRVLLPWLLLLGLTLVLVAFAEPMAWAFRYPREWVLPVAGWINAAMRFLRDEAGLGPVSFQELTRAVSWLIEQPFRLARALLADGFVAGFGRDAVEVVPPLPWLGVVLVLALAGLAAGGRSLALLVGACFLYLAVFGQWDSAMMTLASIVIAVPLGLGLGGALGIWAFRSPRVERLITPVLDLMQTVPVFAYLVPILWFFGFNPVAAMIATVIYAMPPMVRNTTLALRRVPGEITEFGRMAGCTPRQMLWKVLIPSARPGLMVGVNQVIMLSLNMVIIASMIGAGGLGRDVLAALRRLDFGAGLEAAVAITLLAITLDRLSQAFANRPPPVHREAPRRLVARHPHLVTAAGGLALLWLLSLVVPWLRHYPEALELGTGGTVNALMAWINVHLFDLIEAVKAWLLINVMVPVKRFLLGLPWPTVVAAVGLAGWQLGGARLGLQTLALALFVALVGQWVNAMETVYLCGISVVIACALGIPLGIVAAGSERAHRLAQGVVDTLQTLPAFAYLIPAVMLFRVGDFAAMLAVVAYAIVSPIRYTDYGIRRIDPALIEAARAAGCTRRQLLVKVQLPLALPEIMLGVNQTIMMALSMLVITALVGTRDLGQEVYVALTKADVGRGLVAGVCVACIAMIADRLIAPWSLARKRRLGVT